MYYKEIKKNKELMMSFRSGLLGYNLQIMMSAHSFVNELYKVILNNNPA